jgi:hypothetical protein
MKEVVDYVCQGPICQPPIWYFRDNPEQYKTIFYISIAEGDPLPSGWEIRKIKDRDVLMCPRCREADNLRFAA